MRIKLKESDAKAAYELLKELIGKNHEIHWEFQDAAETILFVVRGWPHGQDELIEHIGKIIMPFFDKWFPPQEEEYTWMVTFFQAENDCSGVLICGLELYSNKSSQPTPYRGG
jgi:hypothetical protein